MTPQKNILKIAIIFIFLLLLGFMVSLYLLKSPKTTSLNNKVSEYSFLLKSVDGKIFEINATNYSFKISNIKNKIVFLKAFGWNCQYCNKEIPQLIKLKKKFPKLFDVIAIEVQNHSEKENLKQIESRGINYHIISGQKHKNFLRYLKEHHNWTGMIPLSIVIAEDGKILAFEIGMKSYTLSELLKVSLQQYKVMQNLKKNQVKD